MSDRELMELAAKAAGILYGHIDEHGAILYDDIPRPYWNPLTDDGDALRLAVKLGMCLDIRRTGSVATINQDGWQQPHDDDPYAATRRAIVRTAAEIGRTMP